MRTCAETEYPYLATMLSIHLTFKMGDLKL